MKLKMALKILVHVSAVIGIILSYGNIQGWFKDNSRIGLYNQMLAERVAAVTVPGVQSFLVKYYYTKQLPPDMQSSKVKGLSITALWKGDNPPMAGTAHVEFENGKRTTALCTLDEFRQWVYDSTFYKWAALWLLLIGVTGRISLDLVENRKSETATKLQ